MMTCLRLILGEARDLARAALTGKHDTLVRRAPGWQGAPYASILPVCQQRDWGPGMVKCVGPTRCLMRPWIWIWPKIGLSGD